MSQQTFPRQTFADGSQYLHLFRNQEQSHAAPPSVQDRELAAGTADAHSEQAQCLQPVKNPVAGSKPPCLSSAFPAMRSSAGGPSQSPRTTSLLQEAAKQQYGLNLRQVSPGLQPQHLLTMSERSNKQIHTASHDASGTHSGDDHMDPVRAVHKRKPAPCSAAGRPKGVSLRKTGGSDSASTQEGACKVYWETGEYIPERMSLNISPATSVRVFCQGQGPSFICFDDILKGAIQAGLDQPGNDTSTHMTEIKLKLARSQYEGPNLPLSSLVFCVTSPKHSDRRLHAGTPHAAVQYLKLYQELYCKSETHQSAVEIFVIQLQKMTIGVS